MYGSRPARIWTVSVRAPPTPASAPTARLNTPSTSPGATSATRTPPPPTTAGTPPPAATAEETPPPATAEGRPPPEQADGRPPQPIRPSRAYTQDHSPPCSHPAPTTSPR